MSLTPAITSLNPTTLRRRYAPAAQAEHRPERDEREGDGDRVDELGLDREQQAADGRAITADSWKAIERCASALTRISSGTSDGVNARPAGAPIALPTPCRNASAKNGHTLPAPDTVTARSPLRTTTFSATITTSRFRRGTWSASCPAGSASREGEELRESDEAEVERVLADGVDLPPDRDEGHLQRERLGDERDDEEPEVAVPECGATHERKTGTSATAEPGRAADPEGGRFATAVVVFSQLPMRLRVRRSAARPPRRTRLRSS